MITRADVDLAYRVFFRREPESEYVIVDSLRADSLEALYNRFLESDEFREKFSKLHTPLDWPPMQIEVGVDADHAAAMLAHVEATWRGLGQADPYWSVLSHPQFRKESFREHVQDFKQTGAIDIARFKCFADRSAINLADFKCCLELGCGVGRLTEELSTLFPHIIAADISDVHLRLLKENLPSATVRAALVNTHAALRALGGFDVFFSLIVLQHNPPPIMEKILRTVLGNLKPGGVAYFQIPTYSKVYKFDPKVYLAESPEAGKMEMHALPQKTIFEIVDVSNCKMLEVREDGSTGDTEGISNTFFLQKTGTLPNRRPTLRRVRDWLR
jgi:SAM-dependent methyltransferase